MDQRMMDAMSLQGPDGYLEGSPDDPIQITNQEGYVEEISPEALVAEGMMFAGNYMAKNGPVQPRHIGKAKVMTKAQLEEQKMREAQGYPSNADEAAKVKELEGKVNEMSQGINAILQHLSGQSSPVSVPQPVVTGGNPAPPAASPTPIPEAFVTAKPQSPPSIDSSESRQHEDTQQQQRQVTLSDGRKISVPQTSSRAMGLGPASDPNPTDQVEDDMDDDDCWDSEPIVQQVQVPDDPKPDPKLEKVQRLVQEVVAFMQANDVHRFWRRHLAQKVHRHVGYSGWSKDLQAEFDNRFRGFLNDPQFITTCCKKIIDMEMGHALGVKWVCSFLACTAGFTAFALCGLDG